MNRTFWDRLDVVFSTNDLIISIFRNNYFQSNRKKNWEWLNLECPPFSNQVMQNASFLKYTSGKPMRNASKQKVSVHQVTISQLIPLIGILYGQLNTCLRYTSPTLERSASLGAIWVLCIYLPLVKSFCRVTEI